MVFSQWFYPRNKQPLRKTGATFVWEGRQQYEVGRPLAAFQNEPLKNEPLKNEPLKTNHLKREDFLMEENKPAPKKRGMKPLPPEEKSKRGRKKVVHQEIQDRRQQGAPPLQISFVCDNGASSSTLKNSSSQALNPFHDHINTTTSEQSNNKPSKQKVAPKKLSTITALDESDDDETPVVSRRPRVDVSHLSGEKCIKLLGAHTDKNEWPSSTEVCCWNCTYSFNGIPIAIPAKTNKTGIFTGCYGVFCLSLIHI